MQRRIVVVVEDDPDTRALYTVALEQSGYEVLSVATVREFGQCIGEVMPAAIIMDLGLPDGRGVGLCQRLRRDPRLGRLPIIAVTGWSSGPVVEGVGEAPFNEVFLKPVTPALLIEAVKRWSST